jgi:chromatin remodeling complex protein RSC6
MAPPKKAVAVVAVKTDDQTPVEQSSTEPVVVPSTVPSTVVDVQVDEVEVDKFVKVVDTLQAFQNQIKDMISVIKTLQKEHIKLQKQKGRKTSRKQVVITDETGEVKKRQPSGFAKPTKLSNELCEFLGTPIDTMMPRTEVTRILNEYIKTNKLQDPEDRRKIIPDEKLKKILTLTEGVPLSYFSLQSSIKNHFLKS